MVRSVYRLEPGQSNGSAPANQMRQKPRRTGPDQENRLGTGAGQRARCCRGADSEVEEKGVVGIAPAADDGCGW